MCICTIELAGCTPDLNDLSDEPGHQLQAYLGSVVVKKMSQSGLGSTMPGKRSEVMPLNRGTS